jgi:hypothetical protein
MLLVIPRADFAGQELLISIVGRILRHPNEAVKTNYGSLLDSENHILKYGSDHFRAHHEILVCEDKISAVAPIHSPVHFHYCEDIIPHEGILHFCTLDHNINNQLIIHSPVPHDCLYIACLSRRRLRRQAAHAKSDRLLYCEP